MPNTLKRTLMTLRKRFRESNVESADLSADLLISCILGIERSELIKLLIMHPEMPLEADKLNCLDSLVKRRLDGEPIAYILGEKEFYGRNFKVNQSTLIPRPETELIIDLALEYFGKSADTGKIMDSSSKLSCDKTPSNKEDGNKSTSEKATSEKATGEKATGEKATGEKADTKDSSDKSFIDIGTGSGCIAITLFLELGFKGSAFDISDNALKVARENANLNGATGLNFFEDDLKTISLPNMSLDLLVSNPPYVSQLEYSSLDLGVKGFEPKMALVPTVSKQIGSANFCVDKTSLPCQEKGYLVASSRSEDSPEDLCKSSSPQEIYNSALSSKPEIYTQENYNSELSDITEIYSNSALSGITEPNSNSEPLDGAELSPYSNRSDGTELYPYIVNLAWKSLKPGGLLLMEFGCTQGDAILDITKRAGNWSEVKIIKDYAGLDRICSAVK